MHNRPQSSIGRIRAVIAAAMTLVGVGLTAAPAHAALVDVDPSLGGDYGFFRGTTTLGGPPLTAGPIEKVIFDLPLNGSNPVTDAAGWSMTVAVDSFLSFLTIRDCCIAGDEYAMYLDGASDPLPMVSSTATGSYLGVETDGTNRYDIADLFLGAGTHSFELFLTAPTPIEIDPPAAFGIATFGTTTPVPVPLPAAFPLFGTGAAALGFLAWRKRRKAAGA